jgi:hypothetical protein
MKNWKEIRGCLWRRSVWIQEGKMKYECSCNAENNIRTNFGHSRVIACCIDWQKAFGSVNWTKWMQNWYWLARKNIDQLTAYGSEF